jgi:superfamily II DNA or RNA helicase
MSLQLIKKSLLGGSVHKNEDDTLMNEIEKLKKIIMEKDKTISELSEIASKKKYKGKELDIEQYDLINLQSFLSSEDSLLKNPDIYDTEDGLTAFDKNLSKNPNYFYKYQKKFIEDWAVSAQECVILYYGVGTGKTNIAVNCAEQFINLNNNSCVYFLTPASLVLGVIREMYMRNIDPSRKINDKRVYRFISYQQLLRSSFEFEPNSCLIIDEVHNLRNFKSKPTTEKQTARKREQTGNFSIVGTKLGSLLIENENKFLRTIFMSGTLFVNSQYDIEPIISLGYKKTPKTDLEIDKLNIINNDIEQMKVYYSGLISFYRNPTDTPNFPTVKYYFEPISGERIVEPNKQDSFFLQSRNAYNLTKAQWILNFLKKHKNEKTLIYAQFLDRMIGKLLDLLDDNDIPYGLITGKLSKTEKFKIVDEYNTGKLKIIVFTLAIKEGISFLETNNFIFTQPYWNYAITEQVVARAIRSNSHKQGNKSVVNVYFLIGYSGSDTKIKEFVIKGNQIMNNDIKKFNDEIYEVDKETGKPIDTLIKRMEIEYSGNRDIDLYVRMFKKQNEINIFEQKLLFEVDRFENVNNIENNEFIKIFNEHIINLENDGKILSLKEKNQQKKILYDDFYKREILNTSMKFRRLYDDSRFKKLRNPDLVEKMSNEKYNNKIDEIKKQLSAGASIANILESFKLTKQEITLFQANFTPKSEVLELIKYSGIDNDNREKIMILEPTCGTGNIISELLNLKNVKNFFIDGNEFHNLFYQISKAVFDDIDNVSLYNLNLFDYNQKYFYDYIIGNPPFNIEMQINKWDKKAGKTIIKDVHYYDVNFVSYCYNMLNKDGIGCFIISDRFLRDDKIKYLNSFKKYIDYFNKIDKNIVSITKSGEFQKDDTITENMKTKFGMVLIKLRKIENFRINLEKPPKDNQTNFVNFEVDDEE